MCFLNTNSQSVNDIALLLQILHGCSSSTDMMLLINELILQDEAKRKNGAKQVASQFPNSSKLN